jgi:hypothetical protein
MLVRPSSVTGSGVVAAGDRMTEPTYVSWTLERYQHALHNLARLRRAYLVVILLSWALVAIIYWFGSHWTASTNLWWYTSPDFWWIPVAWLLSVPSFLVAGWGYFVGTSTEPFAPLAPAHRKTSDVVFQVTTLGTEPDTVANTVASVQYWLGRHPEVSFRAHIWIVTEPKGYATNKAKFDTIGLTGARIVVVPADLVTPNRSTKKARALYYANQLRATVFPDQEHVWVYHHDDETALGEDAILGIEEFVRVHRDERSVGYGIILYDQNFSWRPAQVQELTRTTTDLAMLRFVGRTDNLTGMYHGSHYLVRGDVEDDFGWDTGVGTISDDLLFDVGAHYLGAKFYMLHGLAHEQAALTVWDQMKQRRRWIQEALGVYFGKKMPTARRFTAVYFYCLWFIAGATLPLMVLTLWFHIGTFLTAAFMGFIWASMLTSYHRSWTLHKAYVDRRWTNTAITRGIAGAIADSFAPWYAVFTRRPRHFIVVKKDVPHG